MEKSSAPRADVELASNSSSDSQKETVTHQDVAAVRDFPNINESRLMRKIDLRILPMLALMYLMAFLDRVNIGNANVFGLSTELGLSGVQYNVALCIFFIPYILFEIPSNALLKIMKPHLFLSSCMFMFGIVTLAQGFVTNYNGLLATRFFLGFFETGIFPGCFYLLAMWYKRDESQKRFTFFFLSTVLAGAFGGLLASAIGKMDGVGGKNAWRWIFILEGGATALVAVMGYFLVTDFPEDAKWLTEEEKEWVKAKLKKDVGDSGKEKGSLKLRDLKVIVTDYKFMICALMYFGFLIPAYGYAYFAPTIIKGWNYSAIQTQLRTVPIWAVAFVFSMIIAYFSDRMQHRFLFLALPCLLGIVGFIILLTVHDNVKVQYFALFLALMGTFGPTPICICWFSTNLAGHKRRAVGSAFQIAFGNTGGIVATFLFLAADAPRYTKGYSVCLGAIVLSMACAAVYWVGVRRENAMRDAGKGGVIPQSDDEDVGDTHRDFRYMT